MFLIPEAEHSPVVASSAPSSPGWLSTAGSRSQVWSAEQKPPRQHLTPPAHYRLYSLSQLSLYEPTRQSGEPEDISQPQMARCWVDGSEAQRTKLHLHGCTAEMSKQAGFQKV